MKLKFARSIKRRKGSKFTTKVLAKKEMCGVTMVPYLTSKDFTLCLHLLYLNFIIVNFELIFRSSFPSIQQLCQWFSSCLASTSTLFFLYKNVVFLAQAEYSYISADFSLKIFLYYSYVIAYVISVLEYIGVSSIVSAGFLPCWQVLPFRKWNKLKTYNCMVFTVFEHAKLYPFQNLSLGFILKIFLKFRKFQPRYSYKIYSYRKKKSV